MTENNNPLYSRRVDDSSEDFENLIPKNTEFRCQKCNDITISGSPYGMNQHMAQVIINHDTGEIFTWCRSCWRYLHPKEELDECIHDIRRLMRELGQQLQQMESIRERIINPNIFGDENE